MYYLNLRVTQRQVWLFFVWNVRLEHWSHLYVRGWNFSDPINQHCFLFSNILYCSDPGCSAIQFTHSSKQQHGCNQRDMDPPDILTADRPSVHTVTDYLEVSGTFRPQGNCRTWGLWLTEGERNKGILQKVKWIYVKKKKKQVQCHMKFSTNWIGLQQSHALLCVFSSEKATGQRTLLWFYTHPTQLYSTRPLLSHTFSDASWMASSPFATRGRTSSVTPGYSLHFLICFFFLHVTGSFICHSDSQLCSKPYSYIFSNHNLTANITGSDLKGMNIKAKNPG